MSLEGFLTEINAALRDKNGERIADLIHLDVESLPPDRQQPYVSLNAELTKQWPASNNAMLLQRCRSEFTPEEFGTFSASFSDSIARYFRYLRDILTADNLTKALEIRQLTSQCVTALGDARWGVVMIPIVLSFSRALAFIATKLDRNPQLLRQASIDSSAPRGGFVEDAANVLRDAFIKCLAGSPGTQRTSRPHSDDKRIGIYLTANSTLKLLFQCLKHRNAQQIFSSIDAQSPPLAFYPAAQRVTYLYYLGRYHFANNHFLRASATLSAAYASCHRSATNHLRQILTYLIASNLTLGLLPKPQLFSSEHGASLAPIFAPLISVLKSGDIGTFHAILSLPIPTSPTTAMAPNPIAAFFLRRRIHLQLLNRLTPIVYRTLIYRSFALAGYRAEDNSDSRRIPFLRLYIVRAAARFSYTRAPIHPSTLPSTAPLDADFHDLDAALAETNFSLEDGIYSDSHATSATGTPNPFAPSTKEEEQSPTLAEIESIFLSLISQGLLKGFVLHNNPRFAVPGAAKSGDGWRSGFPNVHRAILRAQGVDVGQGQGKDREKVNMALEAMEGVPGWVGEGSLGAGGGGGGRVVNLRGARAVGVS
jgi:nuclear mRNA export protein PCID2/THP1